MNTQVEKGVAYGFSIRDESSEIYSYYLSEFKTEVAMFEGFMESTGQLAQQVTDKGFKFLDFGLIRFCVGVTETGLNVILAVNSSTSKREGFKGLNEIIEFLREVDNLSLSDHSEKLGQIILEFNQILSKIHILRLELLQIMKQRKISSDHMDLDNLDLGVYLKTQDMLTLSDEDRKRSLEKFVDSFTS